jgi:AcrR family transcriptional regulator
MDCVDHALLFAGVEALASRANVDDTREPYDARRKKSVIDIQFSVFQSAKPRSARAQSNDQAIRQAGIEEVLRVGVDHVSLRGVSARAGLTHGATYARYEDANELLVDLWISELQTRAIKLFTLCLNLCETPSEPALDEVIGLARNATSADIASLHVLFAARRIPVLLEEVEPFIVKYLQRENCSSPVVSSAFTRAVCVYSIMAAQIMYSYHEDRPDDCLDKLKTWLLPTLRTNPADVAPIPGVAPKAPFLDIHTTDLKSRIALATYQVVGKSGYTHATLSRIARRARCSTGAIYGLYSSKEALVADTYNLANHTRWRRNNNFTNILDEGVLSQLLFETGSSVNSTWCNYLLEFSIATNFSPVLFETISHETSSIGEMIQLLAGLGNEEKVVLMGMVTNFSLLTYGLSYVAAACGTLECTNFAQFAEPFRQQVRTSVGDTWDTLAEQVNLLAAQLDT